VWTSYPPFGKCPRNRIKPDALNASEKRSGVAKRSANARSVSNASANTMPQPHGLTRWLLLWTKTEQRRAFLVQLRQLCGPVGQNTELARWLKVAEDWTEVADPLRAFREPRKTLKLYYTGSGYQLADVRREGFRDPDPPSPYGNQKTPPPGVKLVDRKPPASAYSESIELELHEDVVLPYEVTEPGYVARTFHVPARVLNRSLGHGVPNDLGEAMEYEEDDSADN
jgi:hypothetical protein